MDSQATSSRQDGPAVVGDQPDGRVARRAGPDRPSPSRLPGPGPPSLARPGPGHRDVQPEGRRRQDDDDDQPRGGPGRVRPPGPPRRLRPPGRPVRGPRPAHPRARRDDLQPPARAGPRRPRHHPGHQGAGPGCRSRQHRPVRRRGPARRRGRPRAGARPGPASGARRLRRRPHRLPALARTAHRQRPDGGARRAHPARVRVLRDAWRRPARRDDREDHRPAQPAPAGRRHPRDDVRRPDPALP